MCGLSMAASIRSVMAGASMRSFECTLATTTSNSASSSSSWSSEPSSRMSTSMPVRRRNGASSSFRSATTSSWARRRSALSPCATVSRALWSVSTRYSCPSSRAASAISRMGLPPSDQSEWEWQSPRSEPSSSSAGASSTTSSGVSSSCVRRSGTLPSRASVMTWAVDFPIPSMVCSRPARASVLSVPASTSATARAAWRKARTL